MEDFLDYITTVEYDYHAPILESTYRRLKEAGWYEGRKIDISNLVRECEKDDVYLTESQKRFIEEFGGLEGSHENANRNWVYIGDSRKIQYHNTELSYFINIFHDEDLELESEEINPIVKNYRKNTVRIGECWYYAQSILLTENGLMLLVDDGNGVKPLGRTAMECFNILLGD